ncbi:TonB-dependent receptor [bacterium]|nr:MAG: TonB-dependent receptor [bacterium]
MAKPYTRGGLLLVATAWAAQSALAQTTPAELTAPADPGAEDVSPAMAEGDEPVDVVGPGMTTITVTGRRERDIQKANTEVVSVLSTEDLARTGEGDIAGALGRVTGLSVVGGGFVYVRGLGDRYSQALLNGSPLPSPEPLRRAVPLDLFPTDVIASSLVQKTYSPNFPGEFGGGVINLTTLAIPAKPFFKLGAGISGDTFTTGQLGYTYYGSRRDWSGYDSGNRAIPPALWGFYASRERISNVDSGAIASQFVTPNNALIQKNDDIPLNVSASATGGTSWMIGDNQLGLIGTLGYDNKWRTRDITQQSPASADLSTVDRDFRNVATENRVVANALVGLSYEFGDQRIRWTNLYVHDTLKRASLAEGKQNNQRPGADFREQGTAWYARQLFDTQLAGTFKFEPVQINARASYATSKRTAPYELDLEYIRTNQSASPYGQYFINRLDNGQSGSAAIAFSDLGEDLVSGGVDATYEFTPTFAISGGVDYTKTERESTRRKFQMIAPSTLPNAVAMLRPDLLISPAVIDYYNIRLIETTEADPKFDAALETKAAFAQVLAELVDGLELSAGVRFERGLQTVNAVQVFNTASSINPSTRLDEDYFLPAATLTYKFGDNMQVRVNGSKTIARPQFRELISQAYFDPETNRSFRGNPLIVDSKFTNGEARFEWYFAPEERFSVAGFYKKIDNPIEAFTGFNDNTPITSFANAPEATLYGVESEVLKYFPLDNLPTEFLSSRRVVAVGNYTYTTSKLKVGAGDTVRLFGTAEQPASNFFFDGAPLTGQSDHLVNLQLGLEHPDTLSQQTLLLSYASNRVTSRGAAGLPDIYEKPGISVDFVARQGFSVFDRETEVKFEARNLLGRDYREFQQRGANKVFYNRYDIGTTFSLSFSTSF